MIPWMREKFAERKAKWEASRKRANFSSDTIGVSDKIPLRKDVSYDSIELYDENADDAILLKIVGYDGRIVPLRLVSTTTIQEVKCQALRELVAVSNDHGTSSILGYKLLKSNASMLALNESLSISQSNLSDCDELLLMKCRLTEENDNENRVQKGPSQLVIDKATVDRIQCGEKTESVGDVNEIMLRCDVKSDIRQILISLAKSSAFVIGASPYAAQIILMFKERLIRQNDLYQLDSLPHCSVQKTLKAETTGNNWEQKTKFLELNERFLETHFLNSSSQESTKRNIEALLEIIRIYAYKHVTTKSNLKEIIWKMGFSKDDVEDALKVAENNYVDACRWLMRTNNNYNDGLLKDSPMLKALITSPHIQLSFSSPKIFIAYISILDNYSSINLWLSDAETAGVIGHVLRTYHEEKHILAINQIS
ncbi:ubiquitin-associated domain-containing protein 1-like [Bradysia coprophila]|uniref:ubiquitin-associated domain-containing protein 1-like n=1 Tax=Bradysia coprophila TaxID=38358 RepID=UPI00187DAF85|nr:ubiquitin-associated domain-containing protein 1-like [Bradysia coprophila]